MGLFGGESTETTSSSKQKIDMKTTVSFTDEVRDALKDIAGDFGEIFDLKSDFWKQTMLPYQKDLMAVNKELLPFISDNMKAQLITQAADIAGDFKTRDELRSKSAEELARSGKLGAELFERVMEMADVDARTQEKRSQITQEFGRMERNLIREGLDPTSPEAKAIKKEMELEKTRQSLSARTAAEREALETIAGAAGTFQARGMEDVAASMRGSMATGTAQAQQFGVGADTGAAELSGAMAGQQILTGERATTQKGTTITKGKQTTETGGGFGSVLSGIVTGGLSTAVGTLAGGVGGGMANMAIGAMGGEKEPTPYMPAT